MILLPVAPGRAAHVVADLDVLTEYHSNLFLDESREWDLALKPSMELGMDFASYWSLGYRGRRRLLYCLIRRLVR